jgi:hypothetical protein
MTGIQALLPPKFSGCLLLEILRCMFPGLESPFLGKDVKTDQFEWSTG